MPRKQKFEFPVDAQKLREMGDNEESAKSVGLSRAIAETLLVREYISLLFKDDCINATAAFAEWEAHRLDPLGIALLKAVERHRKIELTPWATADGELEEITDLINSAGPNGRRDLELAHAVEKEKLEIKSRTGRTPTDTEVLKRLAQRSHKDATRFAYLRKLEQNSRQKALRNGRTTAEKLRTKNLPAILK